MSDIQPLKEDVVHAGTIEDPIPQKLIFVKRDSTGAKKVYTLGMGGTTGGSEVSVSPATDIVTGIVKLTDDHTVDAPAATGSIAITPNGVKIAIESAKTEITDGITDTVNGAIDDALADGGKLDTAIDEALKDSIADGSLDDAINGAVDEVVQDKIESGEIGAGGGEASTLVVKPEIITPTEGAVNVASLPTLQASAFKCLLTTETRLHREFELNTVTPDASVVTKQVNADSVTLDSRLSPTTQYKWRCRDVTNNGLKSAWTSWTNFTTAQGQTVTTPTITLKGYQDSPTDILSGLTIEGSAFAVSEGEDTHKATSWSIANKIGTRSNVWESLNDAVNKTSVIVPEGTLEKGTAYTLTVIYHGTAAYDSAPAVVEFTTSNDFGTVNAPTLTVEGGPNTVYETPTLTGGAFSNTRDPDIHDMTDWQILDSSGVSTIYESLNDGVNKNFIVVPAEKLQVSTAYKARVRYHGAKYGWSAYTTVDFSTVAAFNVVNTPTITVQGAPSNVKETPVLTGTAFGGINVTHKSTDWKILKADDNTEVWKSESDTTNLTSIKVPKGILQVSTAYIFQVRYNANESVSSAWAQTTAICAASFIRYNYIGVPGTSTFGVGLTEAKNYEAVQLEPADNCEVETDFQYGLYERGDYHSPYGNYIGLKFIPKFYIALLQKNQGTENLSDGELDALLPYVEVTKDQMKEAQRRSPHNAMVVAPSDMFTNESDANSHGFYLMRGFIDGDQEQDGFFIANALATIYWDDPGYFLSIGANSKGTYGNSTGLFRSSFRHTSGDGLNTSEGISAPKVSNAKGNFISILEGTPYQCCSIFAWAVISVLSLIQGQYATDTSECAWYDSTLVHNYPKGINRNTKDADDATVTSSTVNTSSGYAFVTTGYEKTTHNGSITGITNVNGWLWQYVIGSWGDGSKLLKRSASIYDITYDNVDDSGASFWDIHDASRISNEWGGTKSSFPDLTGTDKDLFGVYAFGGNNFINSNEFGLDEQSYSSSSATIMVGSIYDSGTNAGIFRRGSDNWTVTGTNYSFRAMAYPGTAPDPITKVTLTAKGNGGTPETQTIEVPKGTTFGEAKKKLVTPTKSGYTFTGWA